MGFIRHLLGGVQVAQFPSAFRHTLLREIPNVNDDAARSTAVLALWSVARRSLFTPDAAALLTQSDPDRSDGS